MLEKPAFTRREFVRSGFVVVSTVATIPTFLQQSALALADPSDVPLTKSKPGVPEDRILVVVQLSGGNDGLNTVVPYSASPYYDGRSGIAIRPDNVLKLDRSLLGRQDMALGLHPSLANLKQMMEQQIGAIVQGVGYPNPNRSHFASMDIWHTCQAQGGRGAGWLGKALDQIAPGQSTSMVAIGDKSPLAGQGKLSQPVSFQNVELFRWTGADLHDKLGAHYDTINRAGVLGQPANAAKNGEPIADDNQAAFVMRTAMDAQVVSDRIRAAVAKGTVTDFRGGKLANQLRSVSAMIRAELPTRVYYVGLGGFDTHAGQNGRHQNLLREFATAMQSFYKELKAMGQDQRVLSVAFSEFGRRVAQNASQGTDHGPAGPMYLFGPMVKPGLLGQHPSLTELDRGDLIFNVDFRSVFATILEQWLKADSTKVLGRRFKLAKVLDTKQTA